ncbi:MAG: hypothetical protein M1821_006086 [Bathelium mastoideum]|nr:MAG: hypothetical protein M1821_006086 [Bathelium mastoideum]KAI9688382.1 MAG: hypothetical protein M1822_001331 [Bathelium mastoideum]
MADKKDLPQIGDKLPPQAAAQLEKQLGGAIETAKASKLTEEAAKEARKRADAATDPEERKRIEQEARELEKTARSQLRVAKRLESGAWQGAGAGIGIGAATGLGLGTVVGAVLGGVIAIPTTTLGGLVGAGTGAIHGPWIKLGGDNLTSHGEEAVNSSKNAVEKVQGSIPSAEAVDEGSREYQDYAAGMLEATKNAISGSKDSSTNAELASDVDQAEDNVRKTAVSPTKQHLDDSGRPARVPVGKAKKLGPRNPG